MENKYVACVENSEGILDNTISKSKYWKLFLEVDNGE